MGFGCVAFGRIGRCLAALGLLTLIAAAPAPPARVKAPLAERAFAEGRYAEAYRLAAAAIAACKPTPRQPDRCLNLLLTAPSYALSAGDAEGAERLARRAIAAAASAPDGGRGEQAVAMVTLAGTLTGQGRLAEAEALNREALALSRTALGEQHILTGTIQNSLALLLDAQGRHAEAEPLHRAAIAIVRATAGEAAAALPTLLTGLGDNLNGQARYRDAEPVYVDALRLAREVNGPRHPVVASALNSLAALKQRLGQFQEAQRLLDEAAAIDWAALGPDHPLVGRDLSNLAALYQEQGKLGEAELQFRKALAIAEKASGPSHPAVASDLGNLAGVLVQLGRAPEAEALTRRALEIDRTAFGDDSPRMAGQYATLAANLEAQQRADEAEPLRRRALEVDRKAYGARHPEVATDLVGLAGNLSLQRRYDIAEPLLREALSIQHATLGPDSLAVAGALSQLGVVEARAGRLVAAEPSFRRALAIRRAVLGEQAPATAGAHHNLGSLLELAGDADSAEAPARQALAIRRAILPPQHPDIAASEALLARVLGARPGGQGEALGHARAAMDVARARRLLPLPGGSIARAELRARAARSLGDPLDRTFSAFLEVAARSPAARALGAEAFVAAQDLGVSAAGLAMAQTAARTAAGEGDLANLARRQQDLSVAIRTLDASAVAALGQGLVDKAAALRADLDGAVIQLAAVEGDLRVRFPGYATLISPRSLTVQDVRARLARDEGLLFIAPSGDDLYVFAVGPRASAWRRVAGGVASVQRQVGLLRCAVDPDTCTTQVGAPAFDPQIAHELYLTLVKPVESGLAGARRLFVTAGGPLADLPLDVLATARPRGGDLAKVRWLADRYAITSLPAVSVLTPRGARPDRGPSTFVGYGDPVFGGGGAGDLKLLRSMPALPGTRTELNALARTLGASPASLVLGAAATEPAVRADSRLAGARVIAFATHGLLPGELNGRNEPGLVFSPPLTASPADDGLLSASEVAELSLMADWVVLSACNTASGEGGSDSLSALARAFLYAGARSLLASHWRVADDATAALTVEMLSTARARPGLSRAEARQQAMRAVRTGRRADGGAVPGWTPAWRDPAAWAPFTLIAASSD